MRAGDLDRQITIETPSESRDAYGEDTQTWATLATVWAQIKPPPRGREQFTGDAQHAVVDTVFRIRWRTDLDHSMRVLYSGDYYDIVAIRELGRQEGLELDTIGRKD